MNGNDRSYVREQGGCKNGPPALPSAMTNLSGSSLLASESPSGSRRCSAHSMQVNTASCTLTGNLAYTELSLNSVQLVAAVVSAAVKNDGDRGWTSFVLLILELNIIVSVTFLLPYSRFMMAKVKLLL